MDAAYIYYFYASDDASSSSTGVINATVSSSSTSSSSFLAFNLTLASNSSLSSSSLSESPMPEWLNEADSVFFSVVFFLLMLLVFYYGLRIRTVKIGTNLPPYPTPLMMSVVAMIIFFIFTTRSVWDIVESSLKSDFLGFGKTDGWHTVLLVLILCWWELVPISLVLVLFWRIPRSVRPKLEEPPPFLSIRGSNHANGSGYLNPSEVDPLFGNSLPSQQQYQ
eukprot:TRINITY_DN2891_c0_g1_i1.p1 TRINITY_DN2891_c0_g1~~TRINITY_DN2891_c0_g1_i1.p1  ORF type:complete len:222 (-),score=48.31 TRINITY_DN2891_c0_g1_i1:105-770(-)